MPRKCTAGACAREYLPNFVPVVTTQDEPPLTRIPCSSLASYTLMLRLNPRDDEAFMNKLWFQKWVCDWRDWASDMHRLRRVLDAYNTKGARRSIFIRD